MRGRQHLRRLLSLEAARLMDESGFRDPLLALRKAVTRLGAQADPSEWPDSTDIVQALRERRRLFHPAALAGEDMLRAMRVAAMEAMQFLAPFTPRAVGNVVDGLLTNPPIVELHLHADDGEAIQRHLADHRIAAKPGYRRVFDHHGIAHDVPVWRVTVEGIDFELLVLPEAMLRQAPRPHPDGPAMARASLAGIRALSAQD